MTYNVFGGTLNLALSIYLSHIQIHVHCTYNEKARNKKAKQTIVHCTTKQYNTRQEMKCNAVR